MTIITTGGPIYDADASDYWTYTWLLAAVSDWMARSDLTGKAADFIRLGELGLNRELRGADVDLIVTGTVGQDYIDISSILPVTATALFRQVAAGTEVEVLPRQDGTFEYIDSQGCPQIWAIDQLAIQFDRPLDQAYTFRFCYRERFQLSDDFPANWLLRDHADLYLAASIVWGSLYIQDPTKLGTWPQVLDRGIASVKRILSKSRRGLLTVDPALTRTTGRITTFESLS